MPRKSTKGNKKGSTKGSNKGSKNGSKNGSKKGSKNGSKVNKKKRSEPKETMKQKTKKKRSEPRKTMKQKTKKKRPSMLVSKQSIKTYTEEGVRVSDKYIKKLNTLFHMWISEMARETARMVHHCGRHTVLRKDLHVAFPPNVVANSNNTMYNVPRAKWKRAFLAAIPGKARMGTAATDVLVSMLEYSLLEIIDKSVIFARNNTRDTLLERDAIKGYTICMMGRSPDTIRPKPSRKRSRKGKPIRSWDEKSFGGKQKSDTSSSDSESSDSAPLVRRELPTKPLPRRRIVRSFDSGSGGASESESGGAPVRRASPARRSSLRLAAKAKP